MKRKLPLIILAMALAATTQAQRYLTEVFTDAQVVLTPNVPYATNINFLTSDFAGPNVAAEITELQTDAFLGIPYPAHYYDPADPTSDVKIVELKMDVYQPDQSVDTEPARPVVIYLHTGNLLPPPINGSPNGLKTDSCAIVACRQLARRGYVAIAIDYRLGWNPLAPTVEERRSGLLNAVYRTIHDTKMCVRKLNETTFGANEYAIDGTKIILLGEGTGGYIALATATLDEPAELFIEKFRPDPFDPTVSYVDTNIVGNLDGYGGQLNLYQPSAYDDAIHFCANMGGALADTSWMADGDVPMVSAHTVRDDFAPFHSGIVVVPTTLEEVLDLQGPNVFIPLANSYGNNESFQALPNGDPFTDNARALYGTTWDVSNGGMITIASSPEAEGMYPIIRPLRPYLTNEASPWQWWDPNSPLATALVAPGVTAHMASLQSNPDMSPAKGRAYLDSVMGYLNPRIVCALALGPCVLDVIDCEGTIGGTALPGTPCDDGDPNTIDDMWDSTCTCEGIIDAIGENTIAGLEIRPNPTAGPLNITSRNEDMLGYELSDLNGRVVRSFAGRAPQYVIARDGIENGMYQLQLQFEGGMVVRKIVLE